MWLTNSSIGRKLIMSITGACLILFLTFHVLMNAVAIISPESYNVICALLGANWYALVGSIGLAVLFLIHIIYAILLTLENRKARGNDRYAVNGRPNGVEWSSRNMLVLGFVVLAFLVLHLCQFWAKMQLAELMHMMGCADTATTFSVNGADVTATPAAGTLFLQYFFGQPWVAPVYIVAFIALWFHMTHGFWSMFQTAGWNNDIWVARLKCIGNWWSSLVIALFIVEAVWFTVVAMNPSCECSYVNDPALKAQYELYQEEACTTEEGVAAPAPDYLEVPCDNCKAGEPCDTASCPGDTANCPHTHAAN